MFMYLQQTVTKANGIIGWWKYPTAVTSLSALLLLSRARIAETPQLNLSTKSKNKKLRGDLNPIKIK